ncbi:PD40 domain-containing protein, partial [Candidatus Sumerlaeota bacterium]|nr:PD40 domain-containing protein [Candidatus Sumerlaeota bacterium]
MSESKETRIVTPQSLTDFQTPVNLVPPNTASAENAPSISPDGLTLTFSSNRAGGQGAYDLWQTSRPDRQSAFNTPANLGSGINSGTNEVHGCLSSDQLEIFFVRSTGVWDSNDLYRATRASTASPFGAAAAVTELNTGSYSESYPYLTADGLRIYFSSDRPTSQGDDIWTATRPSVGSPFGAPSRVAVINTADNELAFGLRADGLAGYLARVVPAGADAEIYEATRPSVGSNFSVPVLAAGLSSPVFDSAPSVTGDNAEIYFFSNRTGGVGSFDLWRSSALFAGIATPGTTNYPNAALRRASGLSLDYDAYIKCAAIDSVAGYAYFGTSTIPGRIIKVALNGGGTPTRVGALELNTGEDDLRSAVIDPVGGYAYFGTGTSPGKVVKVALNGAGIPTRVGSITLNSGENQLVSAAIDPAAGYAYFGTSTSPGIVVKVTLNGSGAPSRVGAVGLNSGENVLTSAVIDPAAGYAYFGTYNTSAPANVAGAVVKIALNGAGLPTRVAALTLNSWEYSLTSAVLDTASGYAYFGTRTDPGYVIKVALGSGTNPPTRVAALTLANYYLNVGVIDPSAGYAYFATGDGAVVKVTLGVGANPPTSAGTLILNPGEAPAYSGIIDTTPGYAYFANSDFPGTIVKVAL